MSILTAILLGLVQGIAEFLPISSSGHVALLQTLFHIEEADLLFDVMLHIGTLFTIFLTYRNDVRGLFRGGLGLVGLGKDRGRRGPKAKLRRHMAIFVIVGTIPLVLAFPIRTLVEKVSASTIIVAVLLLINGLILWLGNRYSKVRKSEKEVSLLDVFLVGLAQVVAVIPGISRSGVTISMGTLRGFERSFAVRYSFLLSIPAVLGALVFTLFDALQAGINTAMLPCYLAGMVASAFSGLFCIRIIRWAAVQNKLGSFAYYCWGAGIIALVLSLIS